MAQYDRRERTFVRTEYVLKSPTNWAEIGKAFAAINQDLGEEKARWDNAATVETRDDEIVIWHEREVPRAPQK